MPGQRKSIKCFISPVQKTHIPIQTPVRKTHWPTLRLCSILAFQIDTIYICRLLLELFLDCRACVLGWCNMLSTFSIQNFYPDRPCEILGWSSTLPNIFQPLDPYFCRKWSSRSPVEWFETKLNTDFASRLYISFATFVSHNHCNSNKHRHYFLYIPRNLPCLYIIITTPVSTVITLTTYSALIITTYWLVLLSIIISLPLLPLLLLSLTRNTMQCKQYHHYHYYEDHFAATANAIINSINITGYLTF